MSGRTQRRKLDFEDLESIKRDVQALHVDGYEAVGNWDLFQVCGHLTEWMQYPMDGFPRVSLPLRMVFSAVRVTMGPRLLRKILAEGSMKDGAPTVPATIPEPGGDEAAAVQRLCDTLQRLQDHDGPMIASPVFGSMDRDTVIQLQRIHCAHHLSFLVPS